MYLCYIKIENGKPVDHPVEPQNLLHVFGEVPDNYQPFNRTDKPALGYFEEWDEDAEKYGFVDGIWTDLWPRKQFTPERIAAIKAQQIIECRAALEHAKVWAAAEREKASEHLAPLWDKYITDLEELVIPDDADLSAVKFPTTPDMLRLDQDGKPLTNTSSGSAPNVIG